VILYGSWDPTTNNYVFTPTLTDAQNNNVSGVVKSEIRYNSATLLTLDTFASLSFTIINPACATTVLQRGYNFLA